MASSASPAVPRAADPGIAYAERLRESFELAAAASGLLEERLRIGSVEVGLRFAGPAMREALLPPFAHLVVESEVDPDGVISLFDTNSTGVLAPELPWPPPEAEPGLNPFARYESTNACIIAAFATAATTAIDHEAGEAIFHLGDAVSLPPNERAAPLREALFPLLASRESWMTHAGVAGTEAGGALIVGTSGSGKSTLALSCARSGMKVVADDYVALELGPEPVANAMQSTVKMTAGAADLLGVGERFPAASYLSTVEGPGKTEVQLESVFPGSLARRMALTAIVAPRVAGLERPLLSRIPPAQALRSLAPSTVLQVRTSSVAPLLPALAALAKSVPCYSLELSTDVDANAAALAAALEDDEA